MVIKTVVKEVDEMIVIVLCFFGRAANKFNDINKIFTTDQA